MSEIININTHLPFAPARGVGEASVDPVTSTRSLPAADTVELSEFARSLAEATESSTYRLARVQAVRAEIAEGTYDSPERIDGTITRLLDVIA